MGNLKIGWGKREISTKEAVLIPGQMYMRVSDGIHDKLYATAMCVDGGQGQDVAIFCTLDAVVVGAGVTDMVKEAVGKLRPELPTENIILGATHTHAGGGTGDTSPTTPDGKPIYSGLKYREFLVERCSQAIVEAWDERAPAGMAYGYGYAVVGHSRRTTYLYDISQRRKSDIAPNGHAAMYGRTNDEWFAGFESGADHFLNAMYTFDADNNLTGIVINVPCPSQLSEHFTTLSSDYWNEVREMVAESFGENVYVLAQCAAAGDLSPRILHYSHAQARRFTLKYGRPYIPALAKVGSVDLYNKVMSERYDIAERILEAVEEIYDWARKDIQTDVRVCHEVQIMELSRRMITEEEKIWCEENIQQMKDRIPEPGADPEAYRVAVTTYNSIKGRNERAIARFEDQKKNPVLPTRVHTVRIGDIAFATIRFELYMDYMHRVQARSPFIQTFVVQLAGDEGATYLATEKGKNNKGYSASLFCNQVGPEGGQEWVEGVLESLKAMEANNG